MQQRTAGHPYGAIPGCRHSSTGGSICAFIVVSDCMSVIDFLLAKAAEHGSIREEMNMKWIKAGYYRPLVYKTSPIFLLPCLENEARKVLRV